MTTHALEDTLGPYLTILTIEVEIHKWQVTILCQK